MPTCCPQLVASRLLGTVLHASTGPPSSPGSLQRCRGTLKYRKNQIVSSCPAPESCFHGCRLQYGLSIP
ncbi:hypothetical protein Ga0080559_TMP2344 [Salipiger profundus]|uniref:Uncharacterized protein n=1 Tax=Salipiger profundus TaxID=1229727 RepID=A0A1U7D4Z5_9RHOB|nr:hypothetical protein Ga0080559_TMP2344 [Salipiger profundus]